MGDGVNVVLDVRIAVGGLRHRVVLRLVRTVGILPGVGHTVVVAILLLHAGIDAPRRRCAVDERLLVADEGTLRAVRHQLVYHVTVGHVAVRQRGTHRGDVLLKQLVALILLQLRIVVGCRHPVAATVGGHQRGAEDAIHVGVLPVVIAVKVEQAVAAAQSVAAIGRTVNKEVRLDIHVALARRVATQDDTAVLPSVDDVVDVLRLTLNLVVTGGVVTVEVTIEGDKICLHQTAGRMVEQPLTDDTILQGNVVGTRALAVGVDGKCFVLSPGKGAVVKNHVLTVGNAGAVLAI